MEDLRGATSVLSLTRSPRNANGRSIAWDPARSSIDAARLDGCHAVVHLAGEPIAARRWSPRVKERILRSRVDGTSLIARTLARLARPPRVFVSASAIGIYGDRGDEVLLEDSPPGHGFLPDVAAAWEAEAVRAEAAGVRVVVLRFGIVLSTGGGALRKMLTPFRLGAGGPLGSGRQWMSWVHIADVVGAIRHALGSPGLRGPVNVVAPDPVRNTEFSRALGRALRRPAVLPVPAIALRLALGEMADALLLSSQRVVPGRLQSDGYAFRFSTIDAALADLLG